jgi:hypothetical protein
MAISVGAGLIIIDALFFAEKSSAEDKRSADK